MGDVRSYLLIEIPSHQPKGPLNGKATGPPSAIRVNDNVEVYFIFTDQGIEVTSDSEYLSSIQIQEQA